MNNLFKVYIPSRKTTIYQSYHSVSDFFLRCMTWAPDGDFELTFATLTDNELTS